MGVRITVVKRSLNQDIADAFFPERKGKIVPCSVFQDGQVFEITGRLPEKPEGFCDWAWVDIHQIVAMAAVGVEPPHGLAFPCCTDGFRPVTFRVEPIASE
ncbi:MAG: TIGR04076 family protein [Candidatus Bipolaricaulis sp.]|nr:TIGR04076 family protein [Candidatus Bipolaricaulis sp.]